MGKADLAIQKAIGETVLEKIREKGYQSVELFAHEHGLSQSVLSRLIAGSRGVSLPTFFRIAKALEISLDELSRVALNALKPNRIHEKTLNRTRARKRNLTVSLEDYGRVDIVADRGGEKAISIELRKSKKTTH